ncbi:hypothetical protein FN846DRAFT_962465 [Sphaerosporella brunnea]|uniref:Uncharacterized protein n=1 Tax=Sphaerosporella brunnea TaxID=1250544 RepID=A0A5J5ENS4_9PEZI|nr:hypothetical protein FN846DRAFT_962465 [Sphaerosporella brunnea]
MRPTGWATAFITFFITFGASLPTVANQDTLTFTYFDATGINGTDNKFANLSSGYLLHFPGAPPPADSLVIDRLTNLSQVTSYGYAKCETSWASPTYSEISGLQDILEKKGGYCQQYNPFGSMCTTSASYFGGDVGLCGMPLFTVSCAHLAWSLSVLKMACGIDYMGRAGGTWYFYPELRGILF